MDYRIDAEIPSEDEILAAERALNFRFPVSYRKFLAADGLSDLRISHRVLRPAEIVDSQANIPKGYVPFADNGCGDLYCWPVLSQEVEPPVYFADHETRQSQPDSSSFSEWLAANKF